MSDGPGGQARRRAAEAGDVGSHGGPTRTLNVAMLGPFGLEPKGTMRARALPAARALAERGHRVELVMPPWHTPEEAGRSWVDTLSGVKLTYVSLRGHGVPGLGHAVVAARMARTALAARPDVVHTFKPKAYGGLAAALLRARQRAGGTFRLVMDTDDWEGPGGWNELEPYNAAYRRFFTWQEKWGLLHADAVTVASRGLETLALSLGVSGDRITYLPNAVWRAANVDDTPSGHRMPPPASPALLLYTRFFDFDLPRPLEVLARVRRVRPEVRLVVAGKGLFGEEDAFLELADRMGLSDAVEYVGWLEEAAAGELFATTNVALFPFDDTLVNRTRSPMKLLDLMAAGLPVVGEVVGEVGQFIEDGVSGRLVAPGDTVAFAAAVVDLLGDEDRRLAIGDAARERVARSFDWSRRVVDLEAVYAR